MTLISAISISLIVAVYFLDQSGYQFPYLDFLCSNYTTDFLPAEKSTKGLTPIPGTNVNINRTDIFKSSNINNNILQEQQEQPLQKVKVNATPCSSQLILYQASVLFKVLKKRKMRMRTRKIKRFLCQKKKWKWRALQHWLTTFSRQLFLQSSLSQMFAEILATPLRLIYVCVYIVQSVPIKFFKSFYTYHLIISSTYA